MDADLQALFVRYSISIMTFWSAVLIRGWHYHNLIAHARAKLSQAICSTPLRLRFAWCQTFNHMGFFVFFNIFQRSTTTHFQKSLPCQSPNHFNQVSGWNAFRRLVDITTCPTTLSQVLGAPKAKPFEVSFWLECIPWTLQSARAHCQEVCEQLLI